ncbi:hypothetical protein [Actinokineospora cianjurensis]|uniref:hypothetical protein n=1 Tax=Actinokineospora cianjurensis TaxID=585224 RepID=UPI0011C3FF92|nr:hypothetical protein [Actinokineospora cianjurensis]
MPPWSTVGGAACWTTGSTSLTSGAARALPWSGAAAVSGLAPGVSGRAAGPAPSTLAVSRRDVAR